MAETKMSLIDWLQERRDNCLLIAAERKDSAAQGWLEDARYFEEAIASRKSQGELIEALENLLKFSEDTTLCATGVVRREKVFRAARAALSKARGESGGSL